MTAAASAQVAGKMKARRARPACLFDGLIQELLVVRRRLRHALGVTLDT
jgi:hypothetical protein